MSPTGRTMTRLRADGWTTEKVEQRLPIPGRYITRDMGGFADGVAWRRDFGILAWQATSGPNVAAHIVKAKSEGIAAGLTEWLLAGGLFQIWGWRKAGPHGERKLWRVRRVGFAIDQGSHRLFDFELEDGGTITP